ncbi:MAG: hypothetical protein ACYYK0_07965 [Candidatus Eutrophobiaceae bacterium]
MRKSDAARKSIDGNVSVQNGSFEVPINENLSVVQSDERADFLAESGCAGTVAALPSLEEL